MNVGSHIHVDPQIMLGKPTLRGTRITVECVLRKMAEGATVDDLIRAHPQLTTASIHAAIQYAAEMVAREETLEVPA